MNQKSLAMVALAAVLWLPVCAGTLNVPGSYATIQAGLNAASSGDVVYVAPGTYTENITWPNVNGITLLSAGNASNTTINGSGSANPVIKISVTTLDITTVIEGFTITGGTGTNINNGGGGGIYIYQSGLTVRNCIIENNTVPASVTGGYGAGIHGYWLKKLIKIEGTIIRNNTINSPTTAYGAGIALRSIAGLTPYGSLEMTNVLLKDNTAPSVSNSAYGPGLYTFYQSSVTITDAVIACNSGPATDGGGNTVNGGGAYVEEGNLTMTRVILNGNDASFGGTNSYGGGLYFKSGSNQTCTGTNVLIADNVLASSPTVNGGGGIYFKSGGALTLTNATIAGNTTADGSSSFPAGAIKVDDVFGDYILKNCILWNTIASSEIVTGCCGTKTVTYSDVRGGHAGTGNINSDPLFVTSGSDYHLQGTSPCIDAGTSAGAPSDDLDVGSRPTGSSEDMGAYESQSYTAEGLCPVNLPLPVTLLTFSGENRGTYNLLFWQTASELNNNYFTVEKSTSGHTWETVGHLKGAGNSSMIRQYSLMDEHPYELTYYRLKQTDYDGRYEYFPPIAISSVTESAFDISGIFPNPASSYFGFTYNGGKEENTLVVSIYNTLGQLVLMETVSPAQTMRANIFLYGVGAGMYSVVFTSGLRQVARRIMVTQ